MMNSIAHTGVAEAAKAYDHQSHIFDDLYGTDTMIAWKRSRVRAVAGSYLKSPSRILELNAGTGEDACWFAQQGHKVHATDNSSGMLEKLNAKAEREGLTGKLTSERCSFTALETLQQRAPYDLVFSNFGGLNCSPHIDKVLAQLPALVKPGGYAVLVFMPRFCLWEFMLLFRGKFRTALRRFAGRKGANAKLNGAHFRCWYFSPRTVKQQLGAHFEVCGHEGLCTIAPPSYLKDFDQKYPRAWKWLTEKEIRYGRSRPWRSCGDYVILSLQRIS